MKLDGAFPASPDECCSAGEDSTQTDLGDTASELMQFTLEMCHNDNEFGLATRSADSLDEGLNDVPEVRKKRRRRQSTQGEFLVCFREAL